MARAPAPLEEIIAYDRVEGWSAPEERGDWLGDVAAERTLLDAYRSGRIHHAWLIGGEKGVGKATLAYRFARFVVAHPNPTAPDVADATDLSVPREHPAFGKIARRAHPNLLILERPWDFESKRFRTQLLVDEIRKTVAFFGTTSGEDGWRVAVVDPADDMNDNAANALLKVLEEPPSRSLFLMVSHAPGRLLPTIRSRARRLDLAPLPTDVVLSALSGSTSGKGASATDMALAAELAGGSLRRSIALLEGEGLDLYRSFAAWVSRLPETDVPGMHAFADRVSGHRDDEAWTAFTDLVRGWLNRRVRGLAEPEPRAVPAAVKAASLERWAEVWEKQSVLVADADEYNLDRKRTVLSILMAIARATRM